jgi:hypothetical protein
MLIWLSFGVDSVPVAYEMRKSCDVSHVFWQLAEK